MSSSPPPLDAPAAAPSFTAPSFTAPSFTAPSFIAQPIPAPPIPVPHAPAPFAKAPPAPEAQPVAVRITVPIPTDEDVAFVRALQRAGLLSELDDLEFVRVVSAQHPRSVREITRNIDLLEAYYEGGGHVATASRRRARDRFFLHREDDHASAPQLVARLGALAPEIGAVSLDRVGGAEGQLVLRAGEQITAVVDDYEETLETNEIDLRELDSSPTITIRGLVRAINALLARVDIRVRLEVYLAFGVASAVELAKAEIIEDDDADELLDLGSW